MEIAAVTNWIPASLSTSDLAMYPLAAIAVIVMILLFFIIRHRMR